jgi:hypothetical protein
MPEFIPGLQLSELYYQEAVKPILVAAFPQLVYSAAFRLVMLIFCMERCCLPASCQRAVPERRMLRLQQSFSAATVEGTARCLTFLVSIKSHQIKHALRRIGAEADDEIAGGFSGGGFAPRK